MDDIGRVIFGDLSATESLSAAIELARIADLYSVADIGVRMAEHIKALINDSRPPYYYWYDSNTYLIDSKHVASAVHLPQGHPVREILAAASVKGYFKKGKDKFAKEAREIPGFSSDLLEAVKGALKGMKSDRHGVSFTDPITGQQISI